MKNTNIPTAAQYLHDGLYYKKGIRGVIFKWVSGEWTRSTKSWSKVKCGRAVNVTEVAHA